MRLKRVYGTLTTQIANIIHNEELNIDFRA
jgi:hypothetical protein